MPFSLMLFLAGSMSHADHAKYQVGFSDGCYHWPAYSGDTFKQQFTIRSLRSTSDQQNSLLRIHCQLSNQRNRVVFTCEKTMLFPTRVPPSAVEVPRPPVTAQNDFLSHLIKQAAILQESGSQTLAALHPGQVILHSMIRPLLHTQIIQLATLARLTHERHFNTRLYRREEMLVPGGLVLAMTCALASRDLHEVLFEELIDCAYPNNLCPGDTVGAVTFIRMHEEHISGDIEAVTVRTIGIKNCDVKKALLDVDLPTEVQYYTL